MHYLDLITPETDISIINEFIKDINLFPKQLESVRNSVIAKKIDGGVSRSGLWTVEMGLGKTILTLGIATLLMPILNAGGLIIISAGTNTIKSFEEYIKNETDLRYVYTTGEAKLVENCIQKVESGQVNCVLCLHSAWVRSLEFNIFVYNNISRIKCMIYDECAGTEDNQGYSNFIEFARYVDFVYPANATPLNDSPYVPYTLLRAVKATDLTYKQFKKKYCIYQTIGENVLEKNNASKLLEDFEPFLINFNRRDVDAETTYENPQFHPIKMNSLQMEAYKSKVDDKASILYGLSPASPTPTANPAFIQLIQTVLSIPNTEGKVLFCRRHHIANMVASVFSGMGLHVMQLNGEKTPSPEEKKYIEDEFNNTQGTLLVTSSYNGNNLNSAKHIIVYETPPDIGQYVARIARGYESKVVHLHWIYYPELEIETLFKAIDSCIDNAIVTKRDFSLARIIFEEAERVNPTDPRIDNYRKILYNE